MIRETKRLTVSIPAGIDNGERIALRGQGCDGRNGGPAGDLIITVGVRKHSFFERDGYNLLCEIPLTIPEATLGAEIKVPTLDGDIPYTIPEGTQNGTVFTVRGKGIPYVNSTRRGDLIFRVNVEIPRGLNDKQKEAHARIRGRLRPRSTTPSTSSSSAKSSVRGKSNPRCKNRLSRSVTRQPVLNFFCKKGLTNGEKCAIIKMRGDTGDGCFLPKW